MQMKALTRRVKIRVVGFLDLVAVPGYLPMGEYGMGQLIPYFGKRFHLLNQHIAVTILISHAANFGHPAPGSNPEIRIQDDHNQAEALQLKRAWQATPPAEGQEWACPTCGETSEPQFTSCWKCGAAKP